MLARGRVKGSVLKGCGIADQSLCGLLSGGVQGTQIEFIGLPLDGFHGVFLGFFNHLAVQQLFAKCCPALAATLRLECDLVREEVELPDLRIQLID